MRHVCLCVQWPHMPNYSRNETAVDLPVIFAEWVKIILNINLVNSTWSICIGKVCGCLAKDLANQWVAIIEVCCIFCSCPLRFYWARVLSRSKLNHVCFLVEITYIKNATRIELEYIRTSATIGWWISYGDCLRQLWWYSFLTLLLPLSWVPRGSLRVLKNL